MGWIADLYGLVGFSVCHQLPERSLSIAGAVLPVCARDTGIYFGYLTAFVLLAALERDRPRDMPPRHVLVLCLLFIAIMGADGVSSYAGWRTTTNDIRLATGLLTGFAIPPLALGMLNAQLWRRSAPGRVLGPLGHRLAWLLALPAAFLVMRFPIPALGGLYATAVIIGVLAAFTTVNLVLVSLLPPFERRAERLGDVLAPGGIALLLTAAELGTAAWLHALALRIAAA